MIEIALKSGASKLSAFYKWLSMVIDFYGLLFVTMTWAFLSIDGSINTDSDFIGLFDISGISVFGYVYIYKVLFLVLPLVVFCVVLLFFEFTDSIQEFLWWQSRSSTLLFFVCYLPMVILAVCSAMVLVTMMGLIAAEFAVFSWTACFVEVFFNDRYQWLDRPVFWKQIIDGFLLQYDNDTDLCWRLCIVNFVLSQSTESEWVKRMFVDFNSWIAVNEYRVFHDDSFRMSLEMLRSQFRDSHCRSAPTMMGSMMRNYSEHIRSLDFFNFQEFAVNLASFLILFVGIPLYVVSRIATLVYPVWCLAYLSMYRDSLRQHMNLLSDHSMDEQWIWMKVPMLNWMTTLFYGIFIVLLIGIGYRLYCLMHILWHIMPGRRKLVKSLIVDKPEMEYPTQLKAMYNFHINRPSIRRVLCQTFADDVGNIIMLYLPRTYPEDIRLDGTKGGTPRRRRESLKRHVAAYWNTPSSSSAHLAIDCVDPLPVSFTKYDSNENSLKYKDFDGFKWYQFDTASIGDT